MAIDKCDILEIRVDVLEKSVQELKAESREDRRQFTQAVEGLNQSLHELKENGIKLNMLLERTDEKLNNLNGKVDTIEQDIKNNATEDEKRWYQVTLSNVVKWLFILIAILFAFVTGANYEQVIGFFV